VGSVSGGHFNPAVSLSFALLKPEAFPWLHLPLYWIAQLLGAIAGGCINLIIFHPFFKAQEVLGGYERGDTASMMTAVGWVGMFPSPLAQYKVSGRDVVFNPTQGWEKDIISPFECMCIEAWGTGILVFVIFCVTDSRNAFFGRG
jgi:glycerol uptake facilitator-like aquaporin